MRPPVWNQHFPLIFGLCHNVLFSRHRKTTAVRTYGTCFEFYLFQTLQPCSSVLEAGAALPAELRVARLRQTMDGVIRRAVFIVTTQGAARCSSPGRRGNEVA